ncbi:MAG: aspartate/glutamate racemase family protein [Anaerolineaceae bacterium]|nr:aspartate/glutamate racemase family protein [Anaerolineaceae bacterium]
MAKKIGILGGMSPESTIAYYEYITRTYTQRFGDFGYPEIIIYSVSFQPFVDWPSQGRWDLITDTLVDSAHHLEKAGADFIVIATNTMHIVFDKIQDRIGIPMLSLLDAVGQTISKKGIKKVGLLGTRFTMQNSFYADALKKYGVEILVPQDKEAEIVDATIYNELVKGIISPASKEKFLGITQTLEGQGAQGVILGCTEIPLLINKEDTNLPLFDTTTIHAEAALDFALRTD